MKTTTKRRHHSPEFKSEALKLATQTSEPSAAKQPGLQESQRYNWRAAANRKASQSEREATLATENARLKRQLAEQAERSWPSYY
ncbi:MAG: transposase [Thiothrix sp.]|nr:transposase [Thiothrix sp.]